VEKGRSFLKDADTSAQKQTGSFRIVFSLLVYGQSLDMPLSNGERYPDLFCELNQKWQARIKERQRTTFVL